MQKFFDKLEIALISMLVTAVAWFFVWVSASIHGSLDSTTCNDNCAEGALDAGLLAIPLTLILSVAALSFVWSVPRGWKIKFIAFVIGGGLVAAFVGYQHGLAIIAPTS